MDNMVEMQGGLKLDCINILTAIDFLLGTLLSLDIARKDHYADSSSRERVSEEVAHKIFVLLHVLDKYALFGKKIYDS